MSICHLKARRCASLLRIAFLALLGQAAAPAAQTAVPVLADAAAQTDPPAEPAVNLYQGVQNPDTLNYLLHLPDGYQDSKQSFPLLFFLHGIAQKGDGSPESLQKIAHEGPFRAMREGRWDQRLPLIVVGPQSSGIQPWWRGEEVRKVFKHVLATYRVDASKRYVSGISMGGRSSWWLAKNFSNEFAALVPASGWAGDVTRSCDVFRGMAVWAFHGAKDPLIGLSAGQKPIEALKACKPALTPQPKITVFDDVGHGSWPRVYQSEHFDSNVGSDGEPYSNIYQWMLTFSRPNRR